MSRAAKARPAKATTVAMVNLILKEAKNMIYKNVVVEANGQAFERFLNE